jgi:hypothetical protein
MPSSLPWEPSRVLHFGQPFAGFFFASDFLTAPRQFPSIQHIGLRTGVLTFLLGFSFALITLVFGQNGLPVFDRDSG